MRTVYALATVACLVCAAPAARAAAWAGGAADGRAVQSPQETKGRAELEEAARLNEEVRRLYGEGKYDEALPLAERVLKTRESILGPDHLLVATAEKNVGAIYNQQKKFELAEAHYRRALQSLEKDPRKNGAAAADAANQLAGIRFVRKDYDESEAYLKRAVELLAQGAGPDHPLRGPYLLNLADFYLYRGSFSKARPHLESAFAVMEAQPPRLDAATAGQLKKYLCPLMAAGQNEAAKRVQKLIYRMEHPEKAAESERLAKEREARGEPDPLEGQVLNGRAVSKAAPSYPEEARQMRASGTVVVHVTVDEAGKVSRAEALCGHPALVRASEEAVRRWKFTPTLLRGEPVKVTGIVTVNYSLR